MVIEGGMNEKLPFWRQETLDAVGGVMRRTHGLDVSCFDEGFLAKAVEKRRLAAGCGTEAGYLERLASEAGEAERLREALRVGYSAFFRNPLTFAVLEQRVLPGLVEGSAGRELRIWSAGCSSGQEAYSVAILLDELLEARRLRLSYRIFATDRSEQELESARTGVYAEASVANVPLRHLGRGLLRKGEVFRVADRIRERVAFSSYDLLDGETSFPPASIYGGFDLVLCCNVLLYYRTEAQGFILEKLRRGLAAGGYLVAGEAERGIVEQAGGFLAVTQLSTVFHKG